MVVVWENKPSSHRSNNEGTTDKPHDRGCCEGCHIGACLKSINVC